MSMPITSYIKHNLLLLGSLCLINWLQAQVSIAGPTCVVRGSEYHYTIDRPSGDSSSYKICVRGGTFMGSIDTCLTQASSIAIKVSWMDTRNGSIKLTSSTLDKSFAVNITAELQPGQIEEGSQEQFIAQGTIPGKIKCTVPTEGSCQPLYSYQWQQSADKISWRDLPQATAKDIRLTTAATEPFYLRRKVTESQSGTIKYSDIASVYIIPKPTKK